MNRINQPGAAADFSELRSGSTFGSLIIAACKRYADREALVFGPQRMTYRDMAGDISRTIQFLQSRGVKRGDAIAVLSHNSPIVVILIIAANIMGVRYTALRAMGSEDDHAFILEDAEIDLLIVDDSDFGVVARALAARVTGLRGILTLSPADYATDLLAEMAKYEPRPLSDQAHVDDISSISYTGGTTGRPKGVVHSHRSYVAFNLLEISEWEWPSDLRFLAATPISHAAKSWILPTFVKGGTFVLIKNFSPESFLHTVKQERITMSFVVPTMLYSLLDYTGRDTFDTSSLENILYGAAPMSPTRMLEALKIFGPIFSQLYGQTEGPTVLAYLPRAEHDAGYPERLLSCGYPTAGVTIKLLDADSREVAVGEVGEICVRGPLVMKEYWKQPHLTAEAFAGGWLRTGDLAKADDAGRLFIVDRAKDMIISGGFNVYPKEVEDALTAHPAVASAAVIGTPDDVWGEAVTAIVVKRPDQEVTGDELARHVKQKRGSEYAPKRVEFVDDIPVTPLGKFDKKALRQRYSVQLVSRNMTTSEEGNIS